MRITTNEHGEIILQEVFSGVGIETDRGLYGICQRDDAIEITLPDGTYLDSDAVKALETADPPRGEE